MEVLGVRVLGFRALGSRSFQPACPGIASLDEKCSRH